MKLNVCVFDTETTGLLKQFSKPVSKMSIEELKEEPFILQLAYVIAQIDTDTETYKVLTEFKTYIKPVSIVMSFDESMFGTDATNVNGITFDMCMQSNYTMHAALMKMHDDCKQHSVTTFIAHNAQFDYKMIKRECARNNVEDFMFNKQLICTKILFKGFALANNIGATLEAAYKFFNNGAMFENAHDAFSDVYGCLNVFINCCKRLHLWPQPNAVCALMSYSNAYHSNLPASIWQKTGWNQIAKIDICMGSVTESQSAKVIELPIQLDYYDEKCCNDYNVSIEKCKHGYSIESALCMINIHIMFSSLVIVHSAYFQLGLLVSMYSKYKADAHIERGIPNALLELKDIVLDTNVLACNLLPQLKQRDNYVSRDAIYTYYNNTAPTIDIWAVHSIFLNFVNMLNDMQKSNRTDLFKQSLILFEH